MKETKLYVKVLKLVIIILLIVKVGDKPTARSGMGFMRNFTWLGFDIKKKVEANQSLC